MGLGNNTHADHSELMENEAVRNGLPDQRWETRHLAFILGRAKRQVNEDCAGPASA